MPAEGGPSWGGGGKGVCCLKVANLVIKLLLTGQCTACSSTCHATSQWQHSIRQWPNGKPEGWICGGHSLPTAQSPCKQATCPPLL